MKYFWTKGEVVWADHNVKAFNNRYGAFDDTTIVPETHRLKVVYAENCEDGVNKVPQMKDMLKILQRASRRSLILFDKESEIPIGWATFHRDHNYVPPVEEEPETVGEETSEEPEEENAGEE